MDILGQILPYTFLVITLLFLKQDLLALKIAEFEVPKLALVGQSYELKCSIQSETGKLAIIKWYKNGSEIYRVQFKPPKTKIFPANGISINEAKSSFGTIVLENITYESSGTYRCEVTEEPNFTTEEDEATMMVTEMLPRVSGESPRGSSSSPLQVNTLLLISLVLLNC